MAEGFAKKKGITAYSAGLEPSDVNPYATKVMKEIGIDISKHKSKNVIIFNKEKFDYIITLCSHADKACPVITNQGKRIHIAFKDPYILAKEVSSEKEKLSIYREIRDKIKNFIDNIEEFLK
jgi:arsenate reductase